MSLRRKSKELRSYPRIYDWSYLVLSNLKNEIIKFSNTHTNILNEYILLDIGCGTAPYKIFFKNYKTYLRLDHIKTDNIDIVVTAEKIPLPDESVDFILCTQVLEHTDDLTQAIKEIYRVLRKKGEAFISVPFAAHIHGTDDRWRFSLYTLRHLFRNFTILSLRDSGGTFISWGQYINTFLAAIPLGRYFGIPIFISVNTLAPLMEVVLKFFLSSLRIYFSPKDYEEIIFNINHSLPLNYSMVIQKDGDSQNEMQQKEN